MGHRHGGHRGHHGDYNGGRHYSRGDRTTADGALSALTSAVDGLVDGDANGFADVFLRDNSTDELTLLSVGYDGSAANGASFGATISDDGKYVAFLSAASNLVEGDTNEAVDVFVVDTTTGEITRVSTSADGAEANGDSRHARISDDGLSVTFVSEADNLVDGDDNATADVFVKTLSDGAIAIDDTVTIRHRGDKVIFNGTSGDDSLVGGDTRDRLLGRAGNDDLSGLGGRDVLKGGSGDDRLDGGAGRDVLFGGAGADTFVFSDNGARDVVRDFEDDIDLIEISGFEFADLTLTEARCGTLISFGDTDVMLKGVDITAVTEDDFLFV